MPEVWMMTREQFVGNWRVDDSDLHDVDRLSCETIEDAAQHWDRRSLISLQSAPGYYLANVMGEPDDVIMLLWDTDNEDWEIVGGYVENTLWVEPFQRGRGLAPELILAKANRMNGHLIPDSYTSAGKAAHESAHRLAVQRALREGFRVPSHVMEAYPELTEPAMAL